MLAFADVDSGRMSMVSLFRVASFTGLLIAAITLYGCGGSGSGAPSANMPGDGDSMIGAGADMPADGDSMTGGRDSMPSFGMPGFFDPRIEADDWRHATAADARTNTGGEEPTLSSSGHDAKTRQIIADSNVTIQLHFWNPGDGTWEQGDPNCSGTTCDYHEPNNAPLTKDNAMPAQELITILPVMRRRGVETTLSSYSGADSLGPWDGNAYAGGLEYVLFGTNYIEWDSGEASSNRFVWGLATGSNPAMGSASYSGIMVGTAATVSDDFWVQGDADVTVHFGPSMTLDVAFSNVTEVGAVPGETLTIDPWTAVPVMNGSYQSGSNFGDDGDRYLEGQFFGPNAEATAGVFYDWLNSDPNVWVEGAFGAARGQQ